MVVVVGATLAAVVSGGRVVEKGATPTVTTATVSPKRSGGRHLQAVG